MEPRATSTPSLDAPLLDATLRQLAVHPATRGIAPGLAHVDYDRALGEHVCQLTQQLCAHRGVAYESAVADFVTGCAEFLRLQRQLERTGRYANHSFEQARRAVYDDHELMATVYLHGLLLSQALWINHQRMLTFFRRRFAAGVPATGTLLEVPAGTGLYLADFARQHPAWRAVGIDLSVAAVAFARDLCRLAGAAHAEVHAGDVFELPPEPYDRVVCGELLEHVEQPRELLGKLRTLLAAHGRLFLTTAIWAASPDHIYLFESAADVRELLAREFTIVDELVLPLEPGARPDARRIPINYACVLRHRPGRGPA